MTDLDTTAMNRRADIEVWLDERRVPWTYRASVPLEEIDQTASLTNQARLEPLNEEVVERYAADMERGDMFPPVLARPKGKRLMLLGGNHRFAAKKQAKQPAIDVYVLDVEPEMALRLMYEDNRRHGFPPSEAERLHHAVHLCNNGYSQEQAGEVCGVSKQKVSRAIAVTAGDRRAASLGLKCWSAIPKSAKYRLASLRSDPVFVAAVELTRDAALDTTAIYELVTVVNDAKSDEAALTAIRGFGERHRDRVQSSAGGAVKRATPRSKMLTGLGTVMSVRPADVAASCPTEDSKAMLKRQLKSARMVIDQTLKALG